MRNRLCESISVIVCKRKENAHVKCVFHFYCQCESMENLASHTFVLVNAHFVFICRNDSLFMTKYKYERIN